ncbi:MAG TPA: carboxylesterase family protein, partial [Bryobacteraceae bacterium]|nr:carboxylesterase family protein [Bryobacteraceae bacterium]
MNRRVFLQASAAFSMAAWADSARPTAIVKTTNGPVRGLSQAGIETFLGLRYAQPPLGPLRFRPPQKLNPWTEVVDADVLGAPSMQLRSGGSAVAFPGDVGKALGEVFTAADDIAKQNEDCLFLNVWTPQLGGSRKRPV